MAPQKVNSWTKLVGCLGIIASLLGAGTAIGYAAPWETADAQVKEDIRKEHIEPIKADLGEIKGMLRVLLERSNGR